MRRLLFLALAATVLCGCEDDDDKPRVLTIADMAGVYPFTRVTVVEPGDPGNPHVFVPPAVAGALSLSPNGQYTLNGAVVITKKRTETIDGTGTFTVADPKIVFNGSDGERTEGTISDGNNKITVTTVEDGNTVTLEVVRN